MKPAKHPVCEVYDFRLNMSVGIKVKVSQYRLI